METSLFESLKKLNLLFWLFASVIIVLLLYAVWRVEWLEISIDLPPKKAYLYSTLAILFTIIPVPSVFYFFSNRAKQSRMREDFASKIEIFTHVSRLRLVIFFLITIYHLNFYLITGDQSSQMFVLILIILFLMSKPTASQFNNDFK